MAYHVEDLNCTFPSSAIPQSVLKIIKYATLLKQINGLKI